MSLIVDCKYYEVVARGSMTERLLTAARDGIYKDFMARMRPAPTDRVLDVGVSDVINDGANVLERHYPYRHNITACGLSDGRDFPQAYPDVRYVRVVPNVLLPFDDNSFEIATSNAVLEHVGSFEHQALFVRELCRVAQRVFTAVRIRLSRSSIPPLFRAPIMAMGCSGWPSGAPESPNGRRRKTLS